MFSFRTVFAAFLLCQTFLSARASIAAIFPLYIYPDDGCTAWTTVFNSITTNPNLVFYIIVNPDSGPDDFDSNYQACVPKLLALSHNVKTVGYVDTANGERASSDVLADIATYMAFPTTYRPSGIFFDDTTATSKFLSAYTTYANQVRADVPNDSIVIFNPGETVTDTAFFSIANFIVTFEDFYDDFSFPSSLVINSANPVGQQIVLLHDGPTTLPTSLIQEMAAAGIAATFITSIDNDDAYETVPPYWAQECAELTSLQ
ncbi:hypothetical protein BT96DRAFT_920310 [Gymnopus androsaceus JB14]|uniref:Spherulin 4-like cell surface protein n=1 Tax=Gymnopus androsaceus JB14 TaxID=1447944 RepID=A0A6A4HK53_9AGAR|nr:hypothetical protein BT96DRAFT_920310 [Gymnopus androsaceus JB14]